MSEPTRAPDSVVRAVMEAHQAHIRIPCTAHWDKCCCVCGRHNMSGFDGLQHEEQAAADAAWAAARREALLEAAERLPAFTEGVNCEGTAFWKERDRDVYSLAVEEAQDGLRRMAEEEA